MTYKTFLEALYIVPQNRKAISPNQKEMIDAEYERLVRIRDKRDRFVTERCRTEVS